MIPTRTMNDLNPQVLNRKSRLILVGLVCLLVATDQITKFAVAAWIPLGEGVMVIDGFLTITHVRNPGAAFGILSQSPFPYTKLALIMVTTLTLIVMVSMLMRTELKSRLFIAGLVLVISGALGNLLDRVFREGVVDFIEVYYATYHWPSFNVADSVISLGVGLLILDMVLGPGKASPGQRQTGEEHASDPV